MRQSPRNSITFCVIDIGSAAIRFDVISYNPSILDTYQLLFKYRSMPRLGSLEKDGSSKNDNISLAEDSMVSFLQKLKDLDLAIDHWEIVGTAVFRHSRNASELCERFEKILGQAIRILDEEAEAILIAKGICHFENDLPNKFWLLDIGGQSTELSAIENGHLVFAKSLQMGAIGLKESYFSGVIPQENERKECQGIIRQQLEFDLPSLEAPILVGSSGTLRCLKRLHTNSKHNTSTDHPLIPHNFPSELMCKFDSLSIQEFEEYLQEEKKRKDLVYSGFLLLSEVIKKINVQHILVSTFSLRHGILMEASEKYPSLFQTLPKTISIDLLTT